MHIDREATAGHPIMAHLPQSVQRRLWYVIARYFSCEPRCRPGIRHSADNYYELDRSAIRDRYGSFVWNPTSKLEGVIDRVWVGSRHCPIQAANGHSSRFATQIRTYRFRPLSGHSAGVGM